MVHVDQPLVSWSDGNAFVSEAEGLKFKSRANQIGHSVANGSPPLVQYLDSCVACRHKDAEMGPTNSLDISA